MQYSPGANVSPSSKAVQEQLFPSGNTSGYARVRRAKSGEALQTTEPSSSLEYPVVVRNGHYALSTIQDLQPTQQLLILTPFEFPNSSLDTFQKALLSNYSIPLTVFQLPYGNTQTNPHAEAAMRLAAQTIIFIDNADSDQMTLIKRTTDMQPLLIMIGPPSKHYIDFMKNLRKKGSPLSSVLALVTASAQGLQNTACLIQWTETQRKNEESVDMLVNFMESYCDVVKNL